MIVDIITTVTEMITIVTVQIELEFEAPVMEE